MGEGREHRGVGSLRLSSDGDPEPSRGSIFCMAITVPAVVTTPWKRKLFHLPSTQGGHVCT